MATHAVRVPEDREVAVLALAGRAAGARRALVARLRDVLEVGAAGALQQVAADGGDVAQLPRGAGQQRLRQQRVALAHDRVRGQRAVGDAGADPQSAARPARSGRGRGRGCRRAAPASRPRASSGRRGWCRPPGTRPAVRRHRAGRIRRRARRRTASQSPPPRSPARCSRRRRSGTGCRSSARGSRVGVSAGSPIGTALGHPSRSSPSIPTAEQICPGVQ